MAAKRKLTPWMWGVGGVTFLAGLLFGYDQGVISESAAAPAVSVVDAIGEVDHVLAVLVLLRRHVRVRLALRAGDEGTLARGDPGALGREGRPHARRGARRVTAAPTATSNLDDVCIATIRTLCIDAIEAANSGHPGTPIGIAPVTYTLWQRFLRFDPADPIWPNRDRFVLSAGHASALLWSLLHLTGVRAVDPEYEILGDPAVSLDDLKRFRQLGSKCPGHPEYRWTSGVETTSGPLGQGVATSVGMAIASRWLGSALQPRGAHALRLRRLRAGGRRLHDGGRRVGGGVVRRPPAPLEPLLDLRLEPGDDRGPHGPHVHRGRRSAVRGVRLERRDDPGRERPRGGGARVPGVPGGGRAPDADRRAQPHRLRHAGRGHAEGARRAARAGRRGGDEALLRLARGRVLPRARRRGRALRGRDRSPWPRGARSVGGAVRGVPGGAAGARRRDRADAAARAARRLGGGDPELPGRREGDRESRLLGPGAERRRGEGALARRRRGRSRPVDEDAPHVRRRRRLLPGGSRGPQPPLRRARVRLCRDRERAGAHEAAAVLVWLPDLLGLRARRDPAVRADGDPRHPRLHARLDRRRRGRADAPARRAARVAARDARAPRLPPGGRERGRRDVALRSCSSATSRPCSCSRARRCRRSTARSPRPRPASRRARTSSSTPRASPT